MNEVVSFFEVTAFSELEWQFAEDVGVGSEMEFYGLAESIAVNHNTAVDAVNIGLDKLAGCIFRDVATMSIENVLSFSLEILSIVVVFIDVPLHQRKTDMEEESVPDLEGFIKELMQPDDIGEGDGHDLEEPRMRQRLRWIVQSSEFLDDELGSIVKEVLADLQRNLVLFLFQLSA